METASIRQLSDRQNFRIYPAGSLKSRKLTPLLAGPVDSRKPRGALPWSSSTSWKPVVSPVASKRTTSSAHSTGPSLSRAQLAEKVNRAEKGCRVEEFGATSPLSLRRPSSRYPSWRQQRAAYCHEVYRVYRRAGRSPRSESAAHALKSRHQNCESQGELNTCRNISTAAMTKGRPPNVGSAVDRRQ